MNGLHPCTLPQRALFAAVRRVSPLCAAFCPDCECVRGTTGKANVAPTCAKNTKSQSSNAIAILRGGAAEWMSFRARAEAKDMELVPTKEPASHLASRRRTGSLPNASNRAEARTHYFVTKSATRVTPCGRGHSTLRSLAPQFQTKPASLGFCLVEGNERYGGKNEKRQTIQHSDFRTGFRNDTTKSGAGAYDAERLCDRVLSRKTHRDS